MGPPLLSTFFKNKLYNLRAPISRRPLFNENFSPSLSPPEAGQAIPPPALSGQSESNQTKPPEGVESTGQSEGLIGQRQQQGQNNNCPPVNVYNYNTPGAAPTAYTASAPVVTAQPLPPPNYAPPPGSAALPNYTKTPEFDTIGKSGSRIVKGAAQTGADAVKLGDNTVNLASGAVQAGTQATQAAREAAKTATQGFKVTTGSVSKLNNSVVYYIFAGCIIVAVIAAVLILLGKAFKPFAEISKTSKGSSNSGGSKTSENSGKGKGSSGGSNGDKKKRKGCSGGNNGTKADMTDFMHGKNIGGIGIDNLGFGKSGK